MVTDADVGAVTASVRVEAADEATVKAAVVVTALQERAEVVVLEGTVANSTHAQRHNLGNQAVHTVHQTEDPRLRGAFMGALEEALSLVQRRLQISVWPALTVYSIHQSAHFKARSSPVAVEHMAHARQLESLHVSTFPSRLHQVAQP